MSYTFEQDPGHGWLGVPVAEVRELGFAVSDYSYWQATTQIVWLEEDCDLTSFARALAARETASADRAIQHDWIVNVLFGGDMVTDHHVNHESFVRSLPRYSHYEVRL